MIPTPKYKYTVQRHGAVKPIVVLADGFRSTSPGRYEFCDHEGALVAIYEDGLSITMAPNPDYKAPKEDPRIAYLQKQIKTLGESNDELIAKWDKQLCRNECLRGALHAINNVARNHNKLGDRTHGLECVIDRASAALVDDDKR